ncbi:SDR family NAD(P)-dependent oxidoreductase [Nisaea nitritireducens]|uniref:SDR family NAD(P)-dependent oxidoreductase n=1 Tax=Nisaea nitritireducens TaxID=568392 RepID=UPI00186680F7|nr:SDR family NAD(P)-dependent oxidoreductase [Nisaea nitritireducens]
MSGRDDLHMLTLPKAGASARSDLDPGLFETLLSSLLGQGLAILNAGAELCFTASRIVDIQAVLDELPSGGLALLGDRLPYGELVLAASGEQERNLYQSEVLGQTVWNVQQVFEVDRPSLDVKLLNRALALLSGTQDILRTRFALVDGRWMQAITVSEDLTRPFVFSELQMVDRDRFRAFVAKCRAKRIKADRAPLFQSWVCSAGGKSYLGFVAHHAAADAFTLPLLFNQIMAIYESLESGREVSLPNVGEQVWQYTLKQFDALSSKRRAARSYWGDKYAGTPGKNELPYRQVPDDAESRGPERSDSLAIELDDDLNDRIVRLQNEFGIPYAQLFTAAVCFLLVRGYGNSQAWIQSFHSRRHKVDLFQTLGEFTNVQSVPYNLNEEGDVLAWLTEIKKRSHEAIGHHLEFSEFLSLSGMAKDDRMASLAEYCSPRGEVMIDSADLDTAGVDVGYGRSLFAESLVRSEESGVGRLGEAVATLFFQLLKMNGRITVVCSWRHDRFETAIMREMMDQLLRVTGWLAANPRAPISELHRLQLTPGKRVAARKPFFVECQLLNRTNEGSEGSDKPIFWVHGAFGDASVYLPMAQKIERPVYGIQARGLFDEKKPFDGVERIAGFYKEMIRTIQPDGSYDLGGYSIGGTFAYEIARQLQAEGAQVDSLTLVDALYPSDHGRIGGDYYDHLYFVALGLIAVAWRSDASSKKSAGDLGPRPSRDERAPLALRDAFARFCCDAGVKKPLKWIVDYLDRMVRIQEGYRIEDYEPKRLARPIDRVHYIKNRDGLFFGTQSAFMNANPEDPLRGVDYWSAWRALLPNLTMESFDVDSHIEMLASDAVQDAVADRYRAAPPVEAANVEDGTGLNAAVGPLLVYLRQQFARILDRDIAEIAPSVPVEEFGMDSLIATELTQRIQTDLEEQVPITVFFECRTIQQLADRIAADFSQTVARRFATSERAATQRAATTPNTESRRTNGKPKAEKSRQVAIVGLAGRYPQAKDMEAFWTVLAEGRDCISEVPSGRWDWQDFFSSDRTAPGAHYSKWGGFLEDVDKFDAKFFNISPREAEFMDPQERLVLEQTWAALEDAGYRREDIGGERNYSAPVSVYVGAMYGEYQFLGIEAQERGDRRALGGSFASIANRISYFLDLHGPSMAIDTACSSSLTAIHMACRDLREGVSDMAIAGGVNLTLHPNKYLMLSEGQFISSKGRCESFGEGGEGFIPAEGVGIVVLKRLDDAERDGDNIYGVIKGSAVNHGGKTHGYTVPNPKAQEHVIKSALAEADIDPSWISYIEAHGTGTKIGDPIEIAGLSRAFRSSSKRSAACWIGSAKSNIGHCEAAAGVAGLAKILLQLQHKRIAPSLHSEVLNPHIEFADTPFTVNQDLRKWKRPKVGGETRPRIAGISSFGAGGANAHLVVEEYQAALSDSGQVTGPTVIVLSARNVERLKKQVSNLAVWLRQPGRKRKTGLADLAYTLQVGREAMSYRFATVVKSFDDLQERLDAFVASGKKTKKVFVGHVRHEVVANEQPEGEAAQTEKVERAIERGKFKKLAKMWVRGGPIDWQKLHQPGSRRRVSLPTYPFLKERHWFESNSQGQVRKEDLPADKAHSLLMATSNWRPVPMAGRIASPTLDRRVFVCGFGTAAPSEQWTSIDSEKEDTGERFLDVAGRLFNEIRSFLQVKRSEQSLIQVIVPAKSVHRALSGLLRTVRREAVGVSAQLIEWEPDTDSRSIQEIVEAVSEENAARPMDPHVAYRSGQRGVLGLDELSASTSLPQHPWRDGGTYVITGGLGGLGRIFASEIAARVKAPVLVLIGRSALSESGKDAVRELEAVGARILYRQLDVANRSEVVAVINDLVDQGLAPDGVIHSAGVIRDNFIANKSDEEFLRVATGKVLGCVNLDEATRHLDLDLFVLFSSAAGLLGNAGQADYATANAFLDAFAADRNRFVQTGQRSGRTLSIDWPLWRDGGMSVDSATKHAIERRSGMVPMETDNGLTAFYRMLSRDETHIAVFEGDLDRLRDGLLDRSPVSTEKAGLTETPQQSIPVPDRSEEVLLRPLKRLFGNVIKLSEDKVEEEELLEVYGLDSVMITQLNTQLDAQFGEVPKTLFFEFSRLKDIADYLYKTYPEAYRDWCGMEPTGQGGSEGPARSQLTTAAPARRVSDLEKTDDAIAIVGMSGHYPQAENLEEFWDNLKAGKDCVSEIPADRWSLAGFFEPDKTKAVETGKSYSKWGGFISGFDRFDPFFFNISPREARLMDPQERVLLKTAWEAMEDAGYTRESLNAHHDGAVGVFAGITSTGFDLYGPELWKQGDTAIPRTCFGSVANRVSYVLNLHGPSMAIDTMCSSSLTALHEACEQIRRGACNAAIVGAVNLYTHPSSYRNLSAARMLSADGRCKSFGKGGDGFVPGEGAGAVLIKPLSRALADGDHIRAVVRGSHLNHGGRTNGYTVPSPAAQADLISEALNNAGIRAREISYFEAHGTGTDLGDPVEVEGMLKAFRKDTDDSAFCALGSVKSNIGHLEAAAGMAGLSKIILQMTHGELAPSLHARDLNPNIRFEGSPFVVQRERSEWKRPVLNGRELPRSACLSSFGAGGSNAHIVLSEAPASEDLREPADLSTALPFIISARSRDSLFRSVENVLAALDRSNKPSVLADCAYTLAVGREAMPCRFAAVVGSLDEARKRLHDFLAGHVKEDAFHRQDVTLLKPDDASRDSIAKGMTGANLGDLCRLWSEGYAVPWETLFAPLASQNAVRRMPLPTYPFEEGRYWFNLERDATPDQTAVDRPASEWDGFSYLTRWQPDDRPATAGASAPDQIWVLHGGDRNAFVRALEDRVARDFPDADIAVFDPKSQPDSICGWTLRVYFVAQGRIDELGADDAEHLSSANELRLLKLVQQVMSQDADGPALDLFALNFEPRANPFGGGLSGLCFAMAQSDHRLRVRSMRLNARELENRESLDRIFDMVQAEPRSARGETVLFDNGVRKQQSFIPWLTSRSAALPKADGGAGEAGFQKGGRYLILGGSGMVGQAISRRLIERFEADLVWVGRSPVDSPNVQNALAQFGRASKAPVYFQADALNPEALEQALTHAVGDGGSLDGALFAAKAIALNDRLADSSAQTFKEILDTRTKGVLNFHHAVAKYRPGFVCYLSSMQAFPFLPANESVGYAAAVTAEQRLVAALKEETDCPVGIVNWGYWQSSVAGTEVEDRLSRHYRFIDDDQGFDLLDMFVKELRDNGLDQAVFAGMRESVAQFMNRDETDMVRQVDGDARLESGCEQLSSSVAFARQSVRPRIVAGRSARDELNTWAARLLGHQLGRTDRQRILARHHRLVSEIEAISTPDLSQDDLWGEWEGYRAGLSYPELIAAASLVDGGVRALPRILTGEAQATEALFPGGSFEKVEALYRENALSDYFNEVISVVASRLVEGRSGRVRILEIGAGTGSTTGHVVGALRELSDKVEKYHYTDISQGFLTEAKRKFLPQCPSMTFGLLDIQNPVAEHGLEIGSYDIVIATNVLHATRNMRETMRNAKALLRRGGTLIVNEVVEKSAVGTATFGLLDGWWLFDDPDVRIPGSPLLDIEGFRRVLDDEGFRHVTEVTGQAAEFGQEVIAAQSDGMVVQPRRQDGHVRPQVPQPQQLRIEDSLKLVGEGNAPAEENPGRLDIGRFVRDALVQALDANDLTISDEVPFADYGVDSIIGVGFVDKINSGLGLDLSATVLFEFTSLRKLTDHISAELTSAATASSEPVAIIPEEPGSADGIAIIGYSGRFPGASDPEALWECLMTGKPLYGELPESFTNSSGGYRWGGLLDGRDEFDPLFFNISPREAESMNRHQRLVLQEGWHALEHAGYDPKSFENKRVGVFVGAEPSTPMGTSFTGGSDAIIASRLSYYLGLSGPALIVNTGCSSSGVALHLACQSLRNEESEIAVAGGASVDLDPDILDRLAETGMLSPTGKCLTFDHRADGTVISEGIGLVVLKPLARALADGDTIHGVIEGAGINQDGASNGITAPSGTAQENLVREVLDRFDIDPGGLSYIETHGTGTALGDPVEANALARIFRQLSGSEFSCVLGSAKAHLGHASAASAVIGLIKILLSMKHGTLPPIPGFERLNERIEFADTPFSIPRNAVPWTGNGRPLKAALSSFGHSGTNAHFVIREARRPVERHAGWRGPILISARDDERLQAVAETLSAFIEANPETDLANLAYTLQVGRHHMEARAVFEAGSLSELRDALRSYLDGENVSGALPDTARRWVSGEQIDWQASWRGMTGLRRIPLPTYPFAKDVFAPQAMQLIAAPEAVVRHEHPLCQRNRSGFDGVRFSSMFDGTEFFLTDHKVHGARVMPGVAYLEMARAAVELATGQSPGRLENVLWERPFEVDDAPVELQIEFAKGAGGKIDFSITSEDRSGDRRVHSRGVAVMEAHSLNETVDIGAVRESCGKRGPSLVDCRNAFDALGIEYGPDFSLTQDLVAGADGILARHVVKRNVPGFVLKPGLMDCALQSAMALTLQDHGGAVPDCPSVPFLLESVEIYGSLPDEVTSWVRRSSGDGASRDREQIDIDLMDDNGCVLVRMRGLTSRRLKPEVPTSDQGSEKTPQDEDDVTAQEQTIFAPVWRALSNLGDQPPSADERGVLVAGGSAEDLEVIKSIYPNARHLPFAPFAGTGEIELRLSEPVRHLIWIASDPIDENAAPISPDSESLITERHEGVGALFELIKALVRADYTLEEMRWTILTTQARPVSQDEPVYPGHAAIHGLVGSMAKEFPHWKVRLLDLEASRNRPLHEALSMPFDPNGDALVCRGGSWFTEKLAPVTLKTVTQPEYRKDGVYVVLGGAGGLGEVWSRHMINEHGSQIVWLGRRPLDAAITAKLDELARFGPRPEYIQTDATNALELRRARDAVLNRFGRIDGLVHSTLILSDKGLVAMSRQEFHRSVDAKIVTAVRMAQVFGRDDLEFVLFFSSLQSFSKAPGQSNYATGCTFIDAFAARLSSSWDCPVKTMNWGYWGSVGAVANEHHRDRMRDANILSIEPAEGMEALGKLISGSLDQLVMVKLGGDGRSSSLFDEDDQISIYPPTIPSGLRMIAS